MRRPVTTLALLSLTLAACGGTSTTEPAAQPADEPVPEAPAAEEPAEAPAAAEPAAEEPTETVQPAPTVLETVPVETDPEPAEGSELEEPAPEPAAEPAPEPEDVWPDDGCSADNSPTPAAAADGPAPLVEIRPESAASPLPDLAVRRINCKGGWENLRNELPADRPLLVWFWAPH